MKKIISTLAAVMATVTSFASVSASAVNMTSTDVYTISTSTIQNDTVVDETVIPAGSVAITVNINNNDGFASSATKLNVGTSADVVVDETGCPVITKGNVLDDSITASAVNNGTVVVSSASSKKTSKDGEMFTIYVADNYSGASVEDITDKSVSIATDNTAATLSTKYVYRIGNVDNDKYINSVDASQVLVAIEDYNKKYSGDLTVKFANAHISEYFPYVFCSEVADTNKDGKIRKADANNILKFYTYVSTDYSADEAYEILSKEYDNFCYEPIEVTVTVGK